MDIAEFFQIFLITIFAISGSSKLLNLSAFKKSLSDMKFNDRLARIVLYSVPIIEILSSLLLLFEKAQIYALFTILFLTVCFTAIGIKGVITKKAIECNCFGNVITEKLGWSTIIKSIVIASVIAFIITSHSTLHIMTIAYFEILISILISIGVLLVYALASLIVYE